MLISGYWRIAALSQIIYQCPMEHGCKGGLNFSDNGESYCEDGYLGPLCSICEPGFYRDSDKNRCFDW